MRPLLLLLILFSVALSAIAQLFLKLGVAAAPRGAGAAFAARVAGQGAGGTVLTYLLSPMVIGGLALYGLGAVVWLFVLARVPLSAAYPFVGLGFILTMVLGITALGETITAGRLFGTLLIGVGCVFVARSIA
jgi:drug/metabolite transporter (DMT)-like permease